MKSARQGFFASHRKGFSYVPTVAAGPPVTVAGVTAPFSIRANVPKVGVSAPGKAAAMNIGANVPKVGVSAPGKAAAMNIVANVPTVVAPASVVEDACQVKFSNWPATGLTITNEGLAGSAYNGTAYANEYHLQTTGAKSFVMANSTDVINIPHGTVINNPGAFTYEGLIFFNDDEWNGHLFWKGWDFACYIPNAHDAVYLFRKDSANDSNYLGWRTPDDSTDPASQIGPTAFFFIQISWNSTLTAPNTCAAPLIKINNVAQSLTPIVVGSTVSWSADQTYNLTFGGPTALNSTLYLERWHNRALSSAELTTNYNYDKWRVGW